MTGREAQIAHGLASSRSIEGIAHDLGISVGTAKVHLRAIFEKTGTHKQAELIAMLASAVAP